MTQPAPTSAAPFQAGTRTTADEDDIAEALRITLRQRAAMITGLSALEQEGRYALIHGAYRSAALSVGQTQGRAQEIADNIARFVRETVRLMEAPRKAPGGLA